MSEFMVLRDAGHKVLAGRKERRRFSLIGYRRFLGDYLGVANKGGFGEVIRGAVNINPADTVYFSCRAEVLVSKFGKSSKPEPRILVVTGKAVYIIRQAIIERRLQIQTERTMSLGSIKSISCSALKDDWFALNVGSGQEPDPLINCIFKTEFFLQMKQATRGAVQVNIANQ